MPQSLTACVRREGIKLALVPSRFADNTVVGYVKTLANAAAMRTSSSSSSGNSSNGSGLGLSQDGGRFDEGGKIGGLSTPRCHVSIPAAEWMVYKDTRDVTEEDEDEGGEEARGEGGGEGGGGGKRGGLPLAVVEVKGPNGMEVIHPLVRPLIQLKTP